MRRFSPAPGSFSLDEITREVATLLRWIPNQSGLRGVEVGTLRGRTAVPLLLARPGLTLHVVDNFDCSDIIDYETPEEVAAAMWRNLSGFWRAHRHQRASLEVAAEMSDNYFDFVYLDAKHDRESVAADIAAWWPKVRPGGILCGHDYDRAKPEAIPGPPWDVKGAVDDFIRRERLGLFVEGYVWGAVRP